jgi:hypothetical protein
MGNATVLDKEIFYTQECLILKYLSRKPAEE